MILKEAYSLGITLLKLNNCNTKLEVRLILQHVLCLSDIEFLINQNKVLNSSQAKELHRLIGLRNRGYPMAYILGYKYFWKDRFIVNSNVLIPRPETEILVAAVLEVWHSKLNLLNNKIINILDIGVGSGCILLSLLKEIIHSIGIGVDICKEALLVCKKNIENLKIAPNRIVLLNQNLFKALNPEYKFDIIVSNPPYIDILDHLVQYNVKKFEPHKALFAKDNGLEIYNEIFKDVSKYLNKDGTLFLEIGIYQKDKVINLNKNKDLIFQKSFKDELSIDRVLLFVKQ